MCVTFFMCAQLAIACDAIVDDVTLVVAANRIVKTVNDKKAYLFKEPNVW